MPEKIIFQERDFQQEGLELIKKLKSVENAYREVYSRLKDLDRPENRDWLSQELQTADIVSRTKGKAISSVDFDGAHLLKLDDNELADKYGIYLFPLTVAIPTEKWSEYYISEDGKAMPIDRQDFDIMYSETRDGVVVEAINRDSREIKKVFEGSGLCTKICPYMLEGVYVPFKNRDQNHPLSFTGIAFCDDSLLQKKHISDHETLHGAFDLFSPFSTYRGNPEDLPPEERMAAVERYIIDEMNSFRVQINKKVWTWLEDGSGKPNFYNSYPTRFFKLGLDAEKVKRCCNVVDHLQLLLPESIITQILLNCFTLDDLLAWETKENGGKLNDQDILSLINKQEEKNI